MAVAVAVAERVDVPVDWRIEMMKRKKKLKKVSHNTAQHSKAYIFEQQKIEKREDRKKTTEKMLIHSTEIQDTNTCVASNNTHSSYHSGCVLHGAHETERQIVNLVNRNKNRTTLKSTNAVNLALAV